MELRSVIKRIKGTETLAEVRKRATDYARKKDLSEAEMLDIFGADLKAAAAREKKMAEKKSKDTAAAKRKITKTEGKSKKPEMMKGGMVNGKAHMYAAGGSVTDNAGLRALKASGPKGMQAYKKITGN